MDDLNRLDAKFSQLKESKRPGSASVYSAVAQVLETTRRSQFICAFTSSDAADGIRAFEPYPHRPIHYVNVRSLTPSESLRVFEAQFQYYATELRAEEFEKKLRKLDPTAQEEARAHELEFQQGLKERRDFARGLIPLAGGHSRCIGALTNQGFMNSSVCDDNKRRAVLSAAAFEARLKTSDLTWSLVFAALRGEEIHLVTEICRGQSFKQLMQLGFYRYVESDVRYFVPTTAPLQLELFCRDCPESPLAWRKHLMSVLQASHGLKDFVAQVLHLIALQLEIGIFDNREPQSVFRFFSRGLTKPAVCTRFNEKATIPFQDRKITVKQAKDFVSLAMEIQNIGSNDLWLVSFSDDNQPGFDLVLLYMNDSQLFAVCLEIKSQVSEIDGPMDLKILNDKFNEFEEQLSEFSKLMLVVNGDLE